MLYGLSKLYTKNASTSTYPGSFDATNFTVSGTNNYKMTFKFSGNGGNSYQAALNYFIFHRVACISSPVDIYLTLDRKFCN